VRNNFSSDEIGGNQTVVIMQMVSRLISTTPEKYQKTTRRAASAAEFGDVLLDVLRLEKDGDTSFRITSKAGRPAPSWCLLPSPHARNA
jgi:hypothetical protein